MPAEDSQPNESLSRQKGTRSVPVIRVVRTPKSNSSGIPQRSRGQRQRPFPARIRRGGAGTLTFPRNTSVRLKPQTRRDVEDLGSSIPDAFRTEKPGVPEPSPSRNSPMPPVQGYSTNLHSYPLVCNPTTSRTNGSVQYMKRQNREREWACGPSKKRRTSERWKREEIAVDLPPDCRRSAFRRSYYKTVFLNELCDRLKGTTGVKILQHRFTDTQLIVTYTPSGDICNEKSGVGMLSGLTYTARDVSHPRIEEPPKSSSAVRVLQPCEPIPIDIPSGSNVKLEDLSTHVPSSLGATQGISASDGTGGPCPEDGKSRITAQKDLLISDVAPKEIMHRPRQFRSGVVTLTYGLSHQEDDRIVSLESSGVEVSPQPEAIEIESTPPPPLLDLERINDHSDVCEELFSIHPEDAESGANTVSSDVLLDEVSATVLRLERAGGDKIRRILTPKSKEVIYSVTMRGVVHEVDMKSIRHPIQKFSPTYSERDLISVEDIALIAHPFDNMAVVAQVHERNALSLFHLEGRNEGQQVMHITRSSVDPDRQRRGVSAVAALPSRGSSLSFASAGYDHIVHLWTFDPSAEQAPFSKAIDLHHSSLIQSLLSVRDRLMSGGADNSLRTWDLREDRTVSTIRTSNSVYQLHETESPETVLIEVAHRDLQFELHDLRSLVNGRPPLRFGYPATHGMHGRYVRGAVDPYGWSTFVSGGRDGAVRTWDLRNVKQCQQEVMCFPNQKVVHAVFSQDDLIAASDDNQLQFLKRTRS